MTQPNREFVEWLRTIQPMTVVKWATAIAVVAFWILAVVVSTLYMFGYYE